MKKSLKLKPILLLASILVAAFATSCGTVHGFGKDVEKVGHSIEHAAH